MKPAWQESCAESIKRENSRWTFATVAPTVAATQSKSMAPNFLLFSLMKNCAFLESEKWNHYWMEQIASRSKSSVWHISLSALKSNDGLLEVVSRLNSPYKQFIFCKLTVYINII